MAKKPSGDDEYPAQDLTQTVPTVPDVAEPLLGFRSWIWERKRHLLTSVTQTQHVWTPGADQKAICARGHAPANQFCTCGVYAAYDIPAAAPYTGVGHIFGLVWGFGQHVVPAENGFRAEYGRIAAFFSVVPEVSLETGRLRRLATRYAVPLLKPHSLVVEDYRPVLATGASTDIDTELRKMLEEGEGA